MAHKGGSERQAGSSPWPPATHLIPIHHSVNMVQWWYTWRKETWLFFFLRMKNTVSKYSTPFDTKYHHKAPAICKRGEGHGQTQYCVASTRCWQTQDITHKMYKVCNHSAAKWVWYLTMDHQKTNLSVLGLKLSSSHCWTQTAPPSHHCALQLVEKPPYLYTL